MQASDSLSELSNLLLELGVRDHRFSGVIIKQGGREDATEGRNEGVASVMMWEAIKTVTEVVAERWMGTTTRYRGQKGDGCVGFQELIAKDLRRRLN